MCREEELTRDVLLEFLKSQGKIEEVKGLVEVAVQTMAGAEDGSEELCRVISRSSLHALWHCA